MRLTEPPSEDVFAIQEALLCYTSGIDNREYDLFRCAFTDDATMTFAKWIDPLEGLESLTTFMEVLHRDIDGSAHRLTNCFIRAFDGSQAEVESYVHALLVREDHPDGPTFDVFATYTDWLRLDEDGWLIFRKHSVPLVSRGNPNILDFAAARQAVDAIGRPQH